MSFLKSYYMSLELNVLVSFITSFIFAPWSYGIVYFFIFLYAYEVFKFAYNHMYYLESRQQTINYAITRLSIILASILGWYLGRLLVRDIDPMQQCYDTWHWLCHRN